jgi:tetratricopeptide (TPR) repeat protein
VAAAPRCSEAQLQDVPQSNTRTSQTPAQSRDTLYARAAALLTARKLPEARQIAEDLQDRNPDDVQVLTLLARIHLAWPVVGRFEAESLLRRAAKLAPGDPEPLYYLGLVGQALGSDDGEHIARNGFVPVLTMNPDYRDTWNRWTTLYRSSGERRAAIAALEHHSGSWDADYWRGLLLVEQERYDDAELVLGDVIQRRPDDPGPWAWLARSRFAAGREVEASDAYDHAIRNAARDTGAVLWRQIRGIASEKERRDWIATPPEQRAAFYRRFWAGRNPDLTALVNPRLAEHFKRLAQARQYYQLLHPASRYFHSRIFRALAGGVGPMPGGLEGAEARAVNAQCNAHLIGARDTALLAGLRPRLADESDTLQNLEDGLDDRGRIFLRHGAPTYRVAGSLGDETWCYINPDGSVLRVSFVRHTGGYGVSGDMVVTPLVSGEAESAALLLSTDESSLPNTLGFTFWPAAFRAADRWRTELMILPDSLAAIATLLNSEGEEVARDTATGRPLHLVAQPGEYLLLLNGRIGTQRGRYRTSIFLPDYGVDAPAVSSMLLASGTLPPDRDTLANAAPHGLVLPASEPLRVYAELYNMGRRDSVSRYVAEYRFERMDGLILRRGKQRTTTVSFPREVRFTPRIVESLTIDPGRLPPGRYRLILEVNDEIRGQRASSALIEFRLR